LTAAQKAKLTASATFFSLGMGYCLLISFNGTFLAAG
jgi:uncharacterized membrane protein (DUF485 family)